MRKTFFMIYLVVVGSLFSDELHLLDGTLLKGTVQTVTEQQIILKTGFAGVLKVPRKQVVDFSTDGSLYIRLEDGAVISGKVMGLEDGEVKLGGEADVQRAALTSIREGWVTADQDPERIAKEKEEKEALRKWRYMVAAKISGKSGNSIQQDFGGSAEAILACKKDELKLNGSYRTGERSGKKTTDERKIGARYTSYFSEPWGWYIRQEFEQDPFENLDLRSTTAFGLSYRVLEKKRKKMGFDAGVSYRHESYLDTSPDSSNIGLDLGLQSYLGGKGQFELNNEFTCVPSMEDMNSYLMTQNSYLDIPVSMFKSWKIRLGLRNDYNSQPSGKRKPLDSRYYSSFVAKWD